MDIRLKPFGHQGQHLRALQAGLKRHNIARNPHFIACWGWRMGAEFRKRGHDVLVFERGYLGDRFSQTSIGWNGLNGRAEFPECGDDGGARFRRLGIALQDWREGGDYALIVGQVPGDAALQGRNLQDWYATQAARGWGMEVKFRPHPLAHKRGPVKAVPGTVVDRGDLGKSLDRAAVVVTYNSNTGVDAMIAGRPVTCEDEGSMIWGVEPETREAWAHQLAWKQWSLAEIESGEALVGIVGRLRNG